MKGKTMRKDYAHNCMQDRNIVGFMYGGKWYAVRVSTCEMLALSKYGKTSKKRGRVACLRFKPSAAWKANIITQGRYFYSAEGDIIEQAQGNENRGRAFERIICEICGGNAEKRRAWWDGGDFTVNDEIIQVKFENGTICTAKQCRMHREDWRTLKKV